MPRGILTIAILALLATAAVAAGQVFFGLGTEVAAVSDAAPTAEAPSTAR